MGGERVICPSQSPAPRLCLNRLPAVNLRLYRDTATFCRVRVITGESACSYHPSSVARHVLSGLYRSIAWKIFNVFGPRSFWYTVPS